MNECIVSNIHHILVPSLTEQNFDIGNPDQINQASFISVIYIYMELMLEVEQMLVKLIDVSQVLIF